MHRRIPAAGPPIREALAEAIQHGEREQLAGRPFAGQTPRDPGHAEQQTEREDPQQEGVRQAVSGVGPDVAPEGAHREPEEHPGNGQGPQERNQVPTRRERMPYGVG